MFGRDREPTKFAGERVHLLGEYYFEAVFRNGAPNMYPAPKRPVQGPLIDPALRKDALLEWEIRRATKANAERWSKRAHPTIELFDFLDDCGHPNPEDDERYDGDLIESFEDAVNKLRPWDRDARDFIIIDQAAYDAAIAARDSNPIYKAWRAAQDEWDGYHDAGVCMKNPQGSVCTTCAELHGTGSEDNGYESHGCYLESDAAEKYGDFWYANGEDDRPALTAA
ncbi:hypothetical protein [Curtobacterium sp. MCSS17_016]|uniref:hypothetical protein n=1 Tax=Curtobacterium sp. MCSS17_016 TaxID=2175644 RepID=UPI000DA9A90A|nr:hypothetical protein [Curtobacterium sp. MCSS17_016]WIE81051.1 hypothetical protein DEJ19_021275 [Curtobacterium sp. MCSS17_016]